MSKPLEIKSLVLHAAMEFPGLESGVSLNGTRYPQLKMEIDGQFVRLVNKDIVGLVPLTNVKFLLLK